MYLLISQEHLSINYSARLPYNSPSTQNRLYRNGYRMSKLRLRKGAGEGHMDNKRHAKKAFQEGCCSCGEKPRVPAQAYVTCPDCCNGTWARCGNTEDRVRLLNCPRGKRLLEYPLKQSFHESILLEGPPSEARISPATGISPEQKTHSFQKKSGPGVYFQRTLGTPNNITNIERLLTVAKEAETLFEGDMETWRPRRHGDEDWAGHQGRSPKDLPCDSLPHDVGAANFGLRSTSCRSSNAGEVHSLREKYKRCHNLS